MPFELNKERPMSNNNHKGLPRAPDALFVVYGKFRVTPSVTCLAFWGNLRHSKVKTTVCCVGRVDAYFAQTEKLHAILRLWTQ